MPAFRGALEGRGRLSRERRHYLLKRILSAGLSDVKLEDPRWNSISVVFSMPKGGRNFANAGYAYSEGRDWWAVSFPVTSVRESVVDFLEEKVGGVPDGLSRVLLQYNRSTQHALLSVELEEPERWDLSPENAREKIEEVRPSV